MNISVKIHFPSGEVTIGVLSFTIDGVKLTNQNSSRIIDEDPRIVLSALENISEKNIQLKSGTRLEYYQKSIIRKYSPNYITISEMYPPSSYGWATHVSETGNSALFSLLKIVDESQYLLSVVDMTTGQLLRLHPIHVYESNILLMETDWTRYNSIIDEIGEDSEEIPLDTLLSSPAPSWPELQHLLDGVVIPNFQRGLSMRDTMEQLVPSSFPVNIRLELMAFLAYTINLKVPVEDPLDFQKSMRSRFKSASLLRLLVYGHVQSILEGAKPPQYIRFLTEADRGILDIGVEPIPTEQDPWTSFWHKIMESFPNNNRRVAAVAENLNQMNEFVTKHPITREDAKKSRIEWNNRFSLIRAGLMLRSYVQEHKIGLAKLVFLGRTNRWPHNHLAWSARLGNLEQNPPYIQVMIMPTTAITKLERLRQKTALVNWSASRINYRLYNPKIDGWKTNLAQIKNSFSHTYTLSRLSKEYDITKNKDIILPTESMARLLDLSSFGMYLSSLEVGSYDEFLQMSGDSIKQAIESLQKKGVIQIQYFAYLSGLVSICLEIKGQMNRLYSIVRALLKHLPSAKILISEEKEVCYVLGRVPEQTAYDILTEFPEIARNHNIEFKGYHVTAYVDYLHNLHQRLLTSEGTWNDDISGLLSQFRSK